MSITPSPAEILNEARRKLAAALDDKAPKYFMFMKQWFRMRSSKEHFDAEARKMLTHDQVKYHNEFLLALLNKVDGLAESSISLAHEKAFLRGVNRRQKASAGSNETEGFDAVHLSDYLPPNSPQGAGSDGVKYVAREVFLPDYSLVMGRFMLAAWDSGLEGVDDDAANIIVVATQMLLKNLLHAVISSRKGYKKRGKYFMYDSGADLPNVFLRNTVHLFDPVTGERVNLDRTLETPSRLQGGPIRHRAAHLDLGLGPLGLTHAPMVTRTTPVRYDPLGKKSSQTVDEMEHSVAMESACSSSSSEETLKVTVEDIYLTLMENRNIIGSHSVYTINMERIANMLCHPST